MSDASFRNPGDKGQPCLTCLSQHDGHRDPQRTGQQCFYPDHAPRRRRRHASLLTNFPIYAPVDGYIDLRYGPPLGAGPDYRDILTTHLSLPRPITAGVPGLGSEIIPQQDGYGHGLDQGYYYPGELPDGPDCQFPLPFSVDEANAAYAPDSCGPHVDTTIEENRASPWSTSKSIGRAASSALSSAGSSDDDMEWAVDLGWTTSEVGSPSQFLESSDTAGLDVLATPTNYKAAPLVASPTEKQQPVDDDDDDDDDDVLARDTKPEPTARVSAPPPTPFRLGRTGISACSQSFYGLRDAVCRSLGKNQHEVACALAAPEARTPDASRTADSVPDGESYPYDGSWWTLESDTALQAYIAVFSNYFYRHVWLPPSFIPKTTIEARVKEARLPEASHLVRGFASAVLALGAYYHHLYRRRRQHGDAAVASCSAQTQEQHCCSRNGDGGDSDGAQASWRLRAALAFRGCMLDCDWMDGSSPSSHGSEEDLLGIRSLAAVMHRCLRRQFSPRASHACSSEMVIPGHGRKQSHWESQDQLRHWVELFPGLKLRIAPGNNGGLPTSTARLAFCMYHHAVFLTHCPWIAAAAGLDSEPVLEHDHDALGRGCCIRACLESAQQVIDAIPCFFSPSSSGTKLQR
ncbi:hypothetical protein CSHISOI_08285 [Colletotrichum shisoi]|uniref:Transcription factor domain-containing protein n=1 Tax=Colletotrichum shisoi TaxID=2078593 RepID=A0A5Q4BKR3_9PEZI|nr:hypothetical protein CSHISOI_08285 [Colletotrichum shisoi]